MVALKTTMPVRGNPSPMRDGSEATSIVETSQTIAAALSA